MVKENPTHAASWIPLRLFPLCPSRKLFRSTFFSDYSDPQCPSSQIHHTMQCKQNTGLSVPETEDNASTFGRLIEGAKDLPRCPY